MLNLLKKERGNGEEMEGEYEKNSDKQKELVGSKMRPPNDEIKKETALREKGRERGCHRG